MRKFGRASAARQKTCTSFPHLSAAVACDFDSAVVFESNRLLWKMLSISNFKNLSGTVRTMQQYGIISPIQGFVLLS